MIQDGDQCDITVHGDSQLLFTNKSVLTVIFLNLITNSIKYSDKIRPSIDIEVSEGSEFYHFRYLDDGPGIDPAKHEKIFEPFEVGTSSDKYGRTGSGLGLANVRNIVEKLEGQIELKSSIGQGVDFDFYLKK